MLTGHRIREESDENLWREYEVDGSRLFSSRGSEIHKNIPSV